MDIESVKKVTQYLSEKFGVEFILLFGDGDEFGMVSGYTTLGQLKGVLSQVLETLDSGDITIESTRKDEGKGKLRKLDC